MLWKVRKAVAKSFAQRGFVLRRQRPYEEYAAIIDALRPVVTEHDLIRVGGDGDGGYLIPDDLDGVEICFSPGVDRVATFEQQMIDRGMTVFQIDASIDDTPLKHERNHFERKFLGIQTRGDFITLDDWVNQKAPAPTGDLILQMDIEGAEWLTLAQVSEETLLRFRVIVLELHDLTLAVQPTSTDCMTPVLERLGTYFDVVHVHANNYGRVMPTKKVDMPDALEVTYLRKDRSTVRTPLDVREHPLDQDNTTAFPPVNLAAMYNTR